MAQAGNVTYKSQQADDVTTQYMDVETRLANLEAQRTRLQELQAQADNLSDLLQIETSLTDVQSQIESWQSQLDWYSNQVQQCTVYVNLNEVRTTRRPAMGFLAAALSAPFPRLVQFCERPAAGHRYAGRCLAGGAGDRGRRRRLCRLAQKAEEKIKSKFLEKGLTSARPVVLYLSSQREPLRAQSKYRGVEQSGSSSGW